LQVLAKTKTNMESLYDNVLAVASLRPQSDSGGSAVNGLSVDTKGYNSGVLRASINAASGSPTTASTVVKLQESADGSTNWADANDNTGNVISATVNPKTTAQDVVLRIEGLNQNRKRYLRIVETTTFTGGTTPAVVVAADILLGVAFTLPTNTAPSNT
jgi:hypothetical protein